jgi:SAM-dependent methyltransferase
VDVERLPFDQFQRYRLVADLVGEVRDGRPSLRVLDVGGRTALLREFLPADRVDLVDMEASESPGLVLGDGSNLPFRDGSFDVVAAFDTLEHVPPPRRAAFVAECARVSRGHVFIAGPYRAPRVDEAEELLLDFLRHKLRVHHRYLEEHRSHGLPDRAATEAGLSAAGLAVASIGHGNLDRWLVLMCLELYVDHDPTLRALGARLFKFYNTSLYASDHREPVYRHVVVGARPGRGLPDARRVLAAAGAPPEVMPALLPLAQELLAFDHQRDALAPELERLHGVVRSLEEDLRQRALVESELGADLSAHRATVATLHAELAREREAHARAQHDLTQDLAGHRATVATLRSELERFAATEVTLAREIEVRGARLGELELELTEHRELVRSVEENLQHHRAELRAHGHALADREARVEDLHAELTATLERARAAEDEVDRLRADATDLVRRLRSRSESLRRAFALRKFGDPPRGA